MNHKHSRYYKYDAETCVKMHYGFLYLIALIFGGGLIAAWVLMILEGWSAYIMILLWCLLYFMVRYVPGIFLGGVLYTDCDAVKMKDILFMIENKVKIKKAKIIWRMLRVQATSFISGCEQESFELLQTCNGYKKTFRNDMFCLSLYMRHYSAAEEWENYQAEKEKLEKLISIYKPSKKNRMAYDQYRKGIEAKEKIRIGKFEEARSLYGELLASKSCNILNRVLIHEQLADLDMKEGKYESAKQHLVFVVQNGGTTYMADGAKEKLQQFE